MTSYPNGGGGVTRFVTNCDKGEGASQQFCDVTRVVLICMLHAVIPERTGVEAKMFLFHLQ